MPASATRAGLIQPDGSLRRRRSALELVVPGHLLLACLGQEQHREEAAKRWIRVCPPGPDGRDEGVQSLALLLSASAPSSRVAAIEDQPVDAIRMPNAVRDRAGRALGYPEQDEPVQASRVDNRLEVGHPAFERQILRVSVGKTASTLVVANERVPLA